MPRAQPEPFCLAQAIIVSAGGAITFQVPKKIQKNAKLVSSGVETVGSITPILLKNLVNQSEVAYRVWSRLVWLDWLVMSACRCLFAAACRCVCVCVCVCVFCCLLLFFLLLLASAFLLLLTTFFLLLLAADFLLLLASNFLMLG